MKDPSTSLQSSRVKRLESSAKSLLHNVLRHTGTHNRRREEAAMWQRLHKIRGSNCQDERGHHSDSSTDDREERRSRRERYHSDVKTREADMGDLNVQQSFLYDNRTGHGYDSLTSRSSQHAHMDDIAASDSRSTAGSHSTYWMRQLDKAEAQDADRWGHGGYKELYPKDFDSDNSEENKMERREKKGGTTTTHKRKRTKKLQDSSPKKSKTKRRHKSDKKRNSNIKKAKRKKRKHQESSTDLDNYSSDSYRTFDKRKKKHKKAKKMKRLSNECSCSVDSECGREKRTWKE